MLERYRRNVIKGDAGDLKQIRNICLCTYYINTPVLKVFIDIRYGTKITQILKIIKDGTKIYKKFNI